MKKIIIEINGNNIRIQKSRATTNLELILTLQNILDAAVQEYKEQTAPVIFNKTTH